MRFNDILRLQTIVKNWLESKDIIAFSVYITLEVPQNNQGLCSISFYNSDQLHEFLDLIDYSVQCNKKDYIILEETDTVLLTGLALVRLYNSLLV